MILQFLNYFKWFEIAAFDGKIGFKIFQAKIFETTRQPVQRFQKLAEKAQ